MRVQSLLQLFLFSLVYISFLSSYIQNIKTNIKWSSQKTSLNMAGVPIVPYYPNKGSKDYQWMDIYNALGRERTLFVGRFLDDENCNQLIASLIWLQGQSEDKPITMYFNVPGANIKPALAVYDVMSRLKCPVVTINMGLTVGMGALLCAVGSPGQRFAMPNSRFLIARTGMEDGFQGQAVEIKAAVANVMKDNVKVTSELARLCGQPVLKLEAEIKRDFYLTAPEAAAYGLIDKVMTPAQPVKMMRYRGSDDDVVNFGHFSEARRVKEGPLDKVPSPENDEAFDEYAAEQMKRAPPKKADRFSGSRCKPISITPSGGDGRDKVNKDLSKNSGF